MNRECKEGWDKRTRIATKEKKVFRKRRPHPDWQSDIVTGRQPSYEKIKSG